MAKLSFSERILQLSEAGFRSRFEGFGFDTAEFSDKDIFSLQDQVRDVKDRNEARTAFQGTPEFLEARQRAERFSKARRTRRRSGTLLTGAAGILDENGLQGNALGSNDGAPMLSAVLGAAPNEPRSKQRDPRSANNSVFQRARGR